MSSLPPILIVDDDPDDVFILKRLLLKAEVPNKTVTFEDPEAAVAHLESVLRSGEKLYVPCLVFTDLNMPRMDGFEFTQWIRRQPALSDVHVIMVSSSEHPADASRALAVGAQKYVVKYPPASVVAQLIKTGGCD